MSNTLVKPVTCKGCRGRGYINRASGIPADHSWCSGTGLVEGDRKTLADQKFKRTRENNISASLRALATTKNLYRMNHAHRGLHILEEKEPQRYDKAVESILRGHPKVYTALADYYLDHKAEDDLLSIMDERSRGK